MGVEGDESDGEMIHSSLITHIHSSFIFTHHSSLIFTHHSYSFITHIHSSFIFIHHSYSLTLSPTPHIVTSFTHWALVAQEFGTQIGSTLFWMKSIYSSNVYRLKAADALVLYRAAPENREKDLLPAYLMDIPLLAKLLADFISTFNELRYVAIRGKGPQICASVNTHLIEMAASIAKAQELVNKIVVPKTRSEHLISNQVFPTKCSQKQDHYDIIVIQFVNTILPLVNLYLQRLFDTNESFVNVVGFHFSSLSRL